ncbi:MAG: RNA methyltransferase [Proteobacteria bacterium]|nr:RNA methyltransferase [Pseudomonadota bacterium]
MDVQAIESLDDPRVAVYRDVRERDLVDRQGLFLVEGRLNVLKLLSGGRFRTRSLLVTPRTLRALEPALASVAPGPPIYVAERPLLARLAGFDLHRGCLAAAERGPALAPEPLVAAPAANSCVVVLEQLTNPDNVGGVFRNAAAFGADAVWLCPRCCDPLYRKAIRVSMGAALEVPFARCSDWPGALRALKRAGYRVVALDPGPASTPLATEPRGGRVALLVGTEGPGLQPATRALADARVGIAMAPGVDSLNVATATGIALHHYARLGGGRPA